MISSPGRPLILITCDDADARHICGVSLRHAGYDVVMVETPDRVLDVAHRTWPELIVTSYPTRTSSGRSVTEAIRADAAFDATPVLSLAGWVRPAELAHARDSGVTESLPMPVAVDVLVGTVRRLIGAPPSVPRSRRLDVAR